MAKQTTVTPLAARSATSGQATIGDRIVDELVEAIELGIDADEYCAARGASATHAECMEVITRKADLGYYASARQYGATHAECMEVITRKADLCHYSRARQRGCSHSEAVERALC